MAALEDPFMKEWRAGISTQVSDLAVQVRTVRETMVTRGDVAQMMAERVDKDTYQVTMIGFEQRIARVEGSWQRMIPWFGLGIGCLSLLSSAAIGIVGIILVLAQRP